MKIQFTFTLVLIQLLTFAQSSIDFEDLNMKKDSMYNGINMKGYFTSGNALFRTVYDTAFGGTWSGFAASTMTDSVSPVFSNQYSSASGKGYNGSSHYAVGYFSAFAPPPVIVFTGPDAGKQVSGFYINNNTYAFFDMKNGSAFSKKFGGTSRNDSDYFILTCHGYKNGVEKNTKPKFNLADFTSPDTAQDYIVKSWQWFDISSLGNVDSITFSFVSSDTGQFGINTPTYFCIDQILTTGAFASINQFHTTNPMQVYPVPSTGKLFWRESHPGAILHIYGTKGEQVYNNSNFSEKELDLEFLQNGIYFLHLNTNGMNYITRIIINH